MARSCPVSRFPDLAGHKPRGGPAGKRAGGVIVRRCNPGPVRARSVPISGSSPRRWLLSQKMSGTKPYIMRKLLAAISLLLFTGAAWGQSGLPPSPRPNQQLRSDREDTKAFPENLRDLPLKDEREQPVRAHEDQPGKSLNKPQSIKPKRMVARDKRPGATKLTSGANQDQFALKPESDWLPAKPQPAPSSSFSLGVSLQQSLEQDFTPKEDEPEGKEEGPESLRQKLHKLIE
jgi:hypothetical protein